MAISYFKKKQVDTSNELTVSQLRRRRLDDSAPFKVTLKDQEQSLLCEHILRVLPGKRMVVLGTWQDKPVVAKLFYQPRKAKYHFEKEKMGVATLLSCRVPTPPLLYASVSNNKRIYVLIFERIVETKSLHDIWQEQTDKSILAPLMHAVVVELATQHVLGIVQRDMHFKNILVTRKQLYTLDGANIVAIHRPLGKKASLDHLGLFFAQFGVGTDALQKTLFQSYAASRGWLVKQADTVYLQRCIKKYNRQRWLHYQEKTTRNCSAFVKQRYGQFIFMYDRQHHSSSLLTLLKNPELAFINQTENILKSGRSSTVAKILINNKLMVIKRYNVKNTWHWLRRCFRKTRAAMGWRLAHLLSLFGITTAKPIAYIEKRLLGLHATSYLLMEYIEGEHIGVHLTQHQPDESSLTRLAERTVRLIRNLAALGVSHGDLKMTNILVQRGWPVLIDLDGMQEHPHQRSLSRVYKKEIKRFMHNWQHFPSVYQLFEERFSEQISESFH